MNFQPRRKRHLPLRFLPALSLFALVAICPVSAVHAGTDDSSPTEQYLLLRRDNPPLVGVTARQLTDSPDKYTGRVVELTGKLSGMVRNGADVVLMLATEQFGAINLTMTRVPTWVQSGGRLRILAIVDKVQKDDGSVTIGMPDLMVIAVASESDLLVAEQQMRDDAARLAERERAEQAALAAARAALTAKPVAHHAARTSSSTTSTALASRGSGAPSAAASASAFAKYLSPAAQRIYPAYIGFVQRWNPRLTGRDADAIASSILVYSEHYGVDPRLVVSLIIAESDFHLQETSNKGAMGLGQLMPDEVHDMHLTNPYDPIQNIAGAVYLLRGRLDHYSTGPGLSMQQIILALASYNAGMGAVKKYGGVPPYRETQNYVRKIQQIYQQLCAGDVRG